MNIIDQLKNGDMRTIGKANEVVQEVLAYPELMPDLFSGLLTQNAGLRMRCADVLAKVAHSNPALLQPYKYELINTVAAIHQQEVQWHVAEIFSLLELDPNDQEQVVTILLHFLETTGSTIVKVFSLQALTDIARQNNKFKSHVIGLIKHEMEQGAPSVISRGKRLLKQLEGH